MKLEYNYLKSITNKKRYKLLELSKTFTSPFLEKLLKLVPSDFRSVSTRITVFINLRKSTETN